MFWSKKPKNRIYLDYAAGAPIREEAKEILIKNLEVFGNPGTLHADGLLAKNLLLESREKVARALSCRDNEIIFTGSATESNNIALFGSIFAWRSKNQGKTPHIVTSKIEHPSVLEVCRHLEEHGLAEITYLDISESGFVDIKKLREALKKETILVSIIFASNEIGTIQPIKEIGKEIRHFKKYVLEDHESIYPILHTDASQAPLYEEIDLRSLPVQLMTISSEKIYGPHGVGMLFVKFGTPLEKILFGGSQELNLRPGTENVAAIASFAEALRLAVSERELESARVLEIQNYCMQKLESNFKGKFILNGAREGRLPNNINVTLDGFDSEVLVIELDALGISVSEKSACNTDDEDESYVLTALRKINSGEGSLRVSFGKETSKKDIDIFISSLEKIFKKYKKFPKQSF